MLTVNPPISTAGLIQKHFNFSDAYSRAALTSKLREKDPEIMCQNLFTGKIVQNFVEIILLFAFFSYHNLKVRLSVITKDPHLISFDFLGLRDPHLYSVHRNFVGFHFL